MKIYSKKIYFLIFLLILGIIIAIYSFHLFKAKKAPPESLPKKEEPAIVEETIQEVPLSTILDSTLGTVSESTLGTISDSALGKISDSILDTTASLILTQKAQLPDSAALPQKGFLNKFIDWDELRIMKELGQDYEEKEECVDLSGNPFLSNNSGKIPDANSKIPPIYEKGRLKIRATPGLSDSAQEIDSLNELKDNVTIDAGVSIDF